MTFIKVVNVGDTGVGKTCVLISYTENEFPEECGPTSFDNYSTDIEHDGRTYTLGLFDTSGNEIDVMRPLTYGDSKLFLIFFSVVDRKSFERVETKWIPEIKKSGSLSPFIIVGNKSDLRSSNPGSVSVEEAKGLAIKTGAHSYRECSAKELTGLGELFDTAIDAAVKSN
ncbi:cell division control protein CDC42 [Acrasis kona]|uniref:Cell division control protein CDC42 n=1 Tax=Acrasis kona TaxID=1008807 RepID=A0AAW2ZCD1_9EUKA